MTVRNDALRANRRRFGKYGLWALQGLVAAAFIAAGAAKLAGAAPMVSVFEQVGVGQWFRYVTGVIEVVGGLMLLAPRFAAIGGLVLATTMIFAVLTHLFLIGGNPVPALGLFALTATIALIRRGSLPRFLGGS